MFLPSFSFLFFFILFVCIRADSFSCKVIGLVSNVYECRYVCISDIYRIGNRNRCHTRFFFQLFVAGKLQGSNVNVKHTDALVI